ncbi:hypothetical protein EJ07DRAFT_157336 [Lizonia empirigonia]|nr:hypothetical protein EJ07DRAFT_157336 [Lizonia empirigonia]
MFDLAETGAVLMSVADRLDLSQHGRPAHRPDGEHVHGMSEDCMGILFSRHGGGCRWKRRPPKSPTGAATTIIVWRAKAVAVVSVPLFVVLGGPLPHCPFCITSMKLLHLTSMPALRLHSDAWGGASAGDPCCDCLPSTTTQAVARAAAGAQRTRSERRSERRALRRATQTAVHAFAAHLSRRPLGSTGGLLHLLPDSVGSIGSRGSRQAKQARVATAGCRVASEKTAGARVHGPPSCHRHVVRTCPPTRARPYSTPHPRLSPSIARALQGSLHRPPPSTPRPDCCVRLRHRPLRRACLRIGRACSLSQHHNNSAPAFRLRVTARIAPRHVHLPAPLPPARSPSCPLSILDRPCMEFEHLHSVVRSAPASDAKRPALSLSIEHCAAGLVRTATLHAASSVSLNTTRGPATPLAHHDAASHSFAFTSRPPHPHHPTTTCPHAPSRHGLCLVLAAPRRRHHAPRPAFTYLPPGRHPLRPSAAAAPFAFALPFETLALPAA